jgi:hypothetical protein
VRSGEDLEMATKSAGRRKFIVEHSSSRDQGRRRRTGCHGLAGIKKICRRSRQQLARRSKRKTEKANWYWDQILIFRSQNIRYYYQK